MRYYRKPPHRKRRHRRLMMLVACLTAAAVLLLALDMRLRPLVLEYAVSRGEWVATKAVNQAVTEALAAESPDYEQLVTIHRADDGSVTSVEANTVTINRLKAAVSEAILHCLTEYQTVSVGIPLGTLAGSTLFSGRGPLVRFSVGVSGSALTTFYSEFSSAGVNQTLHRVSLQVETRLFLATPGGYRSVKGQTEFMVAETVLVGDVPASYAAIDLGEGSSTSLLDAVGFLG